jgi:hypothetical protein
VAVADYLRRELRGDDPGRLVADYPELNLALDVFRHEDQELRWAIEAKLLAGVDEADIAVAAGLTRATIDTFAAVFFDVGDRLENREFIVGTVFALQRNPPLDFRNAGWKSIAVTSGKEALAVALGPDQRCSLDEIKHADLYATALSATVQIRQSAESGQLMDLDLLRHLPKLNACLDRKVEQNARSIKLEANVEALYRVSRVSREHQEYVESQPEYASCPDWQATVQRARDLGLWGWRDEESETAQDEELETATDDSSEDDEADAVAAEVD